MKKILIVDDHDSIRKGIRLVLETKDGGGTFEVMDASNGKTALEMLKDSKPDIAIIDLMMPEMDGFTLCKEIKKLYADLPVVVLTAKADDLTREKIESSYKPEAFLTKPIDNHDLVSKVEELLK